MLEYALLASLIAVVAISSVSALGRTVTDTFNDVAAAAGVDDGGDGGGMPRR